MKNYVRNGEPRRTKNDVDNTYNKYYTNSLGANQYVNQQQQMQPPMNCRQNLTPHDQPLHYKEISEPVASSRYTYDPKIQWAIENGYLQRPEARNPNPRPAPMYVAPTAKGVPLEPSYSNVSSGTKTESHYSMAPFVSLSNSAEENSQNVDPKLQRCEGEKGSQLYRELVRNAQYKKMLEQNSDEANASRHLTYSQPRGGPRRPEHFSMKPRSYNNSKKNSAHNIEPRTSITTNSIEILQQEVEEDAIMYDTEEVEESSSLRKTRENYMEEQIEEIVTPISNRLKHPALNPRVPKHLNNVPLPNVAPPAPVQQPTNKIPKNYLNNQVNYCVRNPQTPIQPFQQYIELPPKMNAYAKLTFPSPVDAAKFAYGSAEDPVWSQQRYHRENSKNEPRVVPAVTPHRQSIDSSPDSNEFQSPIGSKCTEHFANLVRYPKEILRAAGIRVPKFYEQEEVVPNRRANTYHQPDEYSNMSDSQKPYYGPIPPPAYKSPDPSSRSSNINSTRLIQKPHVTISIDEDNSSRLVNGTQQPYASSTRCPEMAPPRFENTTQRQHETNIRRSDDSYSKSPYPTFEFHDISGKLSDESVSKSAKSGYESYDPNSGCSDEGSSKLHEGSSKRSDNSSSKLPKPKDKLSNNICSKPKYKSHLATLKRSDDGYSKSPKLAYETGDISDKISTDSCSKSNKSHNVINKQSDYSSPKLVKPVYETRDIIHKLSNDSIPKSTHSTHKLHDVSNKRSDHSSMKSGKSACKPHDVNSKRLESTLSKSASPTQKPHDGISKRLDHSSSRSANKPQDVGSKCSDDSSSKSAYKPYGGSIKLSDHGSPKLASKPNDAKNKYLAKILNKPHDIGSKCSDDTPESAGSKLTNDNSIKSANISHKRGMSSKRSDGSSSRSTSPANKLHGVSNKRSDDSNQKKIEKAPNYFKAKPLLKAKSSNQAEDHQEKSAFTQITQVKPSPHNVKESCTKRNFIISNKVAASTVGNARTRKSSSPERRDKTPEVKTKKQENVEVKKKPGPCKVDPTPPQTKTPKPRPKTAPGAVTGQKSNTEKTPLVTNTKDEETSASFEDKFKPKEKMVNSSTATVEAVPKIPTVVSTLTETISLSNSSKEISVQCDTEMCNKNDQGVNSTDSPVMEAKCDLNIIMDKIKDFQRTLEKHKIDPLNSTSSCSKPVAISLKKSDNNVHGFHPEQKLIFRVTASQRTMNAETEKITKKSSPNLYTREPRDINLDRKESLQCDYKYLNQRQSGPREISQRVISLNKMQSLSAEISRKIIELDQNRDKVEQKQQSYTKISQKTINLDEQQQRSPEVLQNVIDFDTEQPKSPQISEADIYNYRHQSVLQTSIQEIINAYSRESIPKDLSRKIINLDQSISDAKEIPSDNGQIDEINKVLFEVEPSRSDLSKIKLRLSNDDQICEMDKQTIEFDEKPIDQGKHYKYDQMDEIKQEDDQDRPGPSKLKQRISDISQELEEKRPKSLVSQQRQYEKDQVDEIKKDQLEIDQKRPESPKIQQRCDNIDLISEIIQEFDQKRSESPVSKIRHYDNDQMVQKMKENFDFDQKRPESPTAQQILDHNTETNESIQKLNQKRPESPTSKRKHYDNDEMNEIKMDVFEKQPESAKIKQRLDDNDQIYDISHKGSEVGQNRPESPTSKRRQYEVDQMNEIKMEVFEKRPESPKIKQKLDDNDRNYEIIQKVNEVEQKRPESPTSKRKYYDIDQMYDIKTNIFEKRPESPKIEQRFDENDQIYQTSHKVSEVDQNRPESQKSNRRYYDNDREELNADQHRPESQKSNQRHHGTDPIDESTKEILEVNQNRPESPKMEQRGDQTSEISTEIKELDQTRPHSPKSKRRHNTNDQINNDGLELDQQLPESSIMKQRLDDNDRIRETNKETRDETRPDSAKSKRRHHNDDQNDDNNKEAVEIYHRRPDSAKSKRRHHKDGHNDESNREALETEQKRPDSAKSKRRHHKDESNKEALQTDQKRPDSAKSKRRHHNNDKILDINHEKQAIYAEVRHIAIKLEQEQQLLSRIRQRVTDPDQTQALLSEVSQRVHNIGQRQKEAVPEASQPMVDINQQRSVQSQLSQRSSNDDERQPQFYHIKRNKSGDNQKSQILPKVGEHQVESNDVSKEVIQVHKRQPPKSKKNKKTSRTKTDETIKTEPCKPSSSKTTIRNPSKNFVETRYERVSTVSSSSCSDFAVTKKISPICTSRAASPIVCKIADDKSSLKSHTAEPAKEELPSSSLKPDTVSAGGGTKSIKSIKTDDVTKRKHSRPRSTLTFGDDAVDKKQKHPNDNETATTSSKHDPKDKDKDKAKLRKRGTSKQVRTPPDTLVQTFYKYCIAILAFFKNYPCKYILKYLLFL